MLSKILAVPMLGHVRAALILFLIFCSVLVSLPNIAAVRAAEDYWTTKVPLPLAHAGFKAAAVDQIYSIGGITGAFVVTEQKNQNGQYAPIGCIPEFPSWAPLMFALCTVGVVLVVYKLELCKTQSLES